MSIDEIIKLMQAVSEDGPTNLELEEEELKLLLKREKEMPQVVTADIPSTDTVSMRIAAMWNGLADPFMTSPAIMPQDMANPRVVRDTASGVDVDSGKAIVSLSVGIFYNASSPDTALFVQVGDTMKKSRVLGTVEAMELVNEIESEYDGVVEAVLVNSGEMVGYGQPLFHIK